MYYLLVFLCSFQSCPVNQVEQQERNQRKEGDKQEGTDIPQVGNNHIAIVGNARNNREHLLVGKTINNRANQETQQTWDKIIELAFAAAGGASTRSVTGQSHPDAKNQPANHVTHKIGGWDVWKGEPTQCA